MSEVVVRQLSGLRQLRAFDRFPEGLAGSRAALPDDRAIVDNGPHAYFAAYEGEIMLARLLTGSDRMLNEATGARQGYISLFESRDRPDAVEALMRRVAGYQRQLGNCQVVGPLPPSFSHIGMGLLVSGFDLPPSPLSAHNPAYYPLLWERCGFEKLVDYVGYRFELAQLDMTRYRRAAQWAEDRFGFRVDRANPGRNLAAREEVRKLLAAGGERRSRREMDAAFSALRPLCDRRFIYLAYANGQPIGLLLALPERRGIRIRSLRIMVMQVAPAFRNLGVTCALFTAMYDGARRAGVDTLEASVIAEDNWASRMSAERAGGQLSRIYRQYRLRL